MAGETSTPIPTDESARGITKVLTGFVFQTYNIRRAPLGLEYPDQQGAIRGGAKYDTRYNLTATVYSVDADRDEPVAGDRFDFDGRRWVLDDCAEAGTYNDLLRWNITAHRYNNWPTA